MLPFSIQRIDHVVFRVASLERSIAFYQAVLGCTLIKERSDLGLVHLCAGASMIDLISVDGKLGSLGGQGPGPEARNVDHLCLRVEPFDEREIVAHLVRHAVTPHGPTSLNFGAEGTGPSLYFSDPDGNAIELKGPAGPTSVA